MVVPEYDCTISGSFPPLGARLRSAALSIRRTGALQTVKVAEVGPLRGGYESEHARGK
jgi:hypothetical protein